MGMPSPGWDVLVRERHAAGRRRRRRRRQRAMLWLLTVVTTMALVVIGVFIRDIARVPTVATPAALTKPVPAASNASPRHSASPRPKASPSASQPQVTDTSSGLSYRLLASPWRSGCPATLNTPVFSWSAGENAVAGQVVIGGSAIDWHGNACSGLLQPQFAYSGPADLEPTAMSLADALDPAYYSGVRHDRIVQDSTAMQVSGHQAWLVTFDMTYPADDASQGVTWSSELGAVVVVDRGAEQVPAVFYVSVPSSLGTGHVSLLIGSLRLSQPR
jgi:hypothetical protein